MNYYSSLPISVNEEDSLLGAFAVADPDIISDEMVYGTSGYVIRVRLAPAYNKNYMIRIFHLKALEWNSYPLFLPRFGSRFPRRGK